MPTVKKTYDIGESPNNTLSQTRRAHIVYERGEHDNQVLL
jgi:hypothetical protein